MYRYQVDDRQDHDRPWREVARFFSRDQAVDYIREFAADPLNTGITHRLVDLMPKRET